MLLSSADSLAEILTGTPIYLPMITIPAPAVEEKRRYYVCNRKRCENCCADCNHTTDLEYALYDTHTDFELSRSGLYFEVIRRRP